MDYCLADGHGAADMLSAAPDVDTDGDGTPDGVGLDFDGDGRFDDVLADTDGDGLADHLMLDLDDDGAAERAFTDDGSGTWTVSVDRAGQIRFFGLDGVEHTGAPIADVDGDGRRDLLVDSDGDGLADRALGDGVAYVDVDGDGRWDVKLADTDGDGRADAATAL